MAVRNHTRPIQLYGISDALSGGAPAPIIAQRDPGTNDIAEIGISWINPISNTVWVLTSVVANSATWTTSPASGVGIFTDVTITGGVGLDVLTIDDGNIVVTNGDVTLSGLLTAGSATVNGTTTVNGDLAVTGNVTVTGDFDLTDTASIGLTSTNNAAGAITLTANGGVLETILIRSLQGTGAASLNLTSTAGGITLTGGLATADAINVVASNAAGGIDVDAGTGGIAVDTTGAFSIDGAAASNVTVTGAGVDLTLASVLGSVLVSSTESAALAIYLHANGGVAETVDIHSDQGTSATSVNVHSDVGGVTIASGLASADAINITASNAAGGIDIDAGTNGFIVDTTGAFSLDSAAASNVTTTGAGIDLTLSSVLGSVLVSSTEDAALAIRLHADGGTSETIQLHSDQGTGVGSINLLSDVGGLTFRATGLASADAINLEAPAGGIDVDAALQINITSSQNAVDAIRILSSAGGMDIDAVGAATEDINITNTGGSVVLVATEAAADALRFNASDAAGGIDIDSGTAGFIVDTTGAISLDAAAASNFTATGAFDVTVSSTAGSVVVSGGEAVADAVQLTAGNAAGGVTVATGTGGLTVNASNGIIALNSGTAAINIGTDAVAHTVTIGNVSGASAVVINTGTGGLQLGSTGAGDIAINSDDTLLLDADGVLELNSSAGAISIGNDADAQGINVGTAGVRPIIVGNASAGTTVLLNSPANVGITLANSIRVITGAGSPNGAVTAPAGSLWLRTDPAGATSRIYVNTDSATTWTNITCAA